MTKRIMSKTTEAWFQVIVGIVFSFSTMLHYYGFIAYLSRHRILEAGLFYITSLILTFVTYELATENHGVKNEK